MPLLIRYRLCWLPAVALSSLAFVIAAGWIDIAVAAASPGTLVFAESPSDAPLGGILTDLALVLWILPVALVLTPCIVFASASFSRSARQGSDQDFSGDAAQRFLVLVPAYNEAAVIMNSVGSLLQQRYPKSHYEVVVVFNGTDATGKIAAEGGATVLSTPAPGVGKRAAIQFALDELDVSAFDYVLIFDADNVVHKDFLANLNACARRTGAVALQGNHQPLEVSKNWISRGLGAAYRASSGLYNFGRARLLKSALLCGTGFAVRADVLLKLWPHIRTLTEDIELNGLIERHYRAGVEWVSDSWFFDEKPDSLSVSIRQRTRWMVGHLWCGMLYAAPLLWFGLRHRRVRAIELACYYLVPLALLSSFLFLAAAPFLPADKLGLSAHWGRLVTGGIVAFYVGYVMVGDCLERRRLGYSISVAGAVLNAMYAAVFALLVWPVAVSRACFLVARQDWIFHTPHRSTGKELPTYGSP